jgi:hypothetical protein
MVAIRSDARERLAEALTLTMLVRDSQAAEVREQHLGRIERVLEALRDSIEETSAEG